MAVTVKGSYDATTQYEPLDIVIFSGESYIATQNSLGEDPDTSEKWQLISTSKEVIRAEIDAAFSRLKWIDGGMDLQYTDSSGIDHIIPTEGVIQT